MSKWYKKGKLWLLIIIGLVVCISSVAVIKYNQVPSEYRNLAKEYLELRESNSNHAYDLCYFKPEYAFVKQALIDNGNKVLNTDIKEFKKVNSNLYSFLVEYELKDFKERGYSFVANIEGKLYVIVNKRDIPDNLKENYNENEYTLKRTDSVLDF